MRFRFACALILLLSGIGSFLGAGDVPTLTPENCPELGCAQVLPGSHRFVAEEEGPYVRALDVNGQTLGWLVVSTEVTDIKGYSGAPLVTLVGLDTDGRISGAKILTHNEPILLVGIPEQALTDFVAFYTGKPATAKVVVGKTSDKDAFRVDAISGATVTALSQNRTILDTALALGEAVGLIQGQNTVPGHFVREQEPLSWEELVEIGAFGRIRVSERDMGGEGTGPFMDLFFTLADAPQVGKGLLAEGDYRWLMNKLEPGEHLLVVLGRGSNSFKGSGFVRGGLFDRIRLEQGLKTQVFRDRDYFNLSHVAASDAPEFKEGAVFITRSGKLDPGKLFQLTFLASRYDGRGGFGRSFHEFSGSLRLPSSIYELEGPDPSTQIWRQAWLNKKGPTLFLASFLAVVLFLFAARRWTTGRMGRLQRLHLVVMAVSVLVLGFFLKAQPSVTQILTFLDGVAGSWRWDLFLSEPLLFVFWIFIALVLFIWGRGVFCGWVCPYGAMNELVFKLGQKLGIKGYEFPEKVHNRLRYVRYGVFAVLVVLYFISPSMGERAAEVEPFKTTFFVAPWDRAWWYVAWWFLLLVAALLMYRPFCRYLCPLGAALALPSSWRKSGPFRRSFCQSCKICTKGCEPRAIRSDGSIDPRECLSCMECEANFRDDEVCPPLITQKRILEKHPSDRTERERAKLEKARKDAIAV